MGDRLLRFLEKALDCLSPEELQSVTQRLARERALFEVLINAIEDGVLVTDLEGRILLFNSAVVRLLGIPDQVPDEHTVERYLPDLSWGEIAQAARNKKGVFQRHEFQITYPTQRFLRLEVASLNGIQNDEMRVALVLHDVTEAKKKTFEAMESERVAALTMLAASVAHEIGNPLNALSIHLQLMGREIKKVNAELERQSREVGVPCSALVDTSLEKLDSYLKIARGEIGRLDTITTQFLQAMRPSVPKFKMVLLNDVVKGVLELMRPEIENHQVLTEVNLLPSLTPINLDAEQMKQVLVNLIKNAIQVMPGGGKLNLTTGQNRNWLWLSIRDTGPGMTQEQLRNLFTPFFTTRKNGSGLGLMIVQRIIRAHRGRIEVQSQEGEGTEFRLILPLRDPEPNLLTTPDNAQG